MQISNHKSRKRKIIFWCALALSFLWLLFIFSNSLDNGVESGQKSSSVTQFVNEVLHTVGFKATISHAAIRTLAHFGEFAILAVLVCLTLSFAPKKLSPLLSAPICLVCASADEFLQLFSDGRAMQLTDVLTDTLGAICGVAAFMLIHFTVDAIIKKTKENQKEPL